MQTPKASVAGFRRAFREPEDLSGALVGAAFEFLPAPGRPFEAELRVLKLGTLLLQVANQSPHASRGAMAFGMSVMILPLRYAEGPARINGASVDRSAAFLAPGGVEFHGQCTTDVAWAALAAPPGELEALAEVAPPPLRGPGAVGVLALPDGPQQRLAAAIAAAARMADSQPEALSLPGCADGLALSLQELLGETLTADCRLLSIPRATREAHRVVRAAEAFLAACPDQPIYREQLCEALGVSLRKLHDAFVAITGMSPHAFLKTRRLLQARRALRGAGHTPARVKTVALSHGFWHFGHFARDYRAQFAESPSSTGTARTGRRMVPAASVAGTGLRASPRSYLPNLDTR